MHLLIFSSILGCIFAIPVPGGGYGGISGVVIGGHGGGVIGGHGSGIVGGHVGGIIGGLGGGVIGGYGGYGGGATDGQVGAKCGLNLALNALGKCVEPIFTRNTFFYNSPPTPYIDLPPPIIPTPKIDYDLVFLRSPEVLLPPEPIIVPANERRSAVFLLNKNQPVFPQKVIEAPIPPQQSPEVFFVNYDYGDNPILPGGVSLKEALAAAEIQQGQVIGGIGGGIGLDAGVGIGSGIGIGGGIGIGSGYGASTSSNYR